MAREGDERLRTERSPRRWLVRFTVLVAGLAVLVAALPWLVSRTNLRQRILPTLVPEFAGTSQIGSAQLGWFSPVELGDVGLTDDQGHSLATAARIVCDQTLLELLFDGPAEATIRIERPTIDLVVYRDGSNWEDAIRPILQRDSSDGADLAVTFEITDGVVRLHDADRRLTSTLTRWELNGHYRPGEPVPIVLETSATASTETASEETAIEKSASEPDTSEPVGQLAATIRLTPVATVDRGSGDIHGELVVQALSVSAATLTSVLDRFAPDFTLQGYTSCNATINWDEAGVRIGGTFNGKQLAIASSEWLGGDTLQMEHVDAELELALVDDQLHVAKCQFDSDMAKLNASGTLNLDPNTGTATLFGNHDYRAEGQADLARLAAQIPAALRIRNDARLTSGQVNFSVNSTVQDGRRHWNATMSANQLEADAGGRPVRWQRPLSVQLSAQQRVDGRVVGKLRCDSEHLKIFVDGSAQDATITVAGDLTRLTSDLRPLIDLNDLKLAGQLNASFALKRSDDGQFDANGHVLLQQFHYSMPGQRPLHEDRMTIALEAVGAMSGSELKEIRHAAIRMNSIGDRLQVVIRQPIVAPASAQTEWPLTITARGNVATWLPRIQSWLPLSGWQLQGHVDLEANTTLSAADVAIESATIRIGDLRAMGAGRVIEQKVVQATTSGTWDLDQNVLVAGPTTVQSTSAELRTDALRVQLASGDKAPSVAGVVTARGDLGALHRWLVPQAENPQTALHGQLQGRLQLDNREGPTDLDGEIAVHDFQLLRRVAAAPQVADGSAVVARPIAQQQKWVPAWTEQKLVIAGAATHTAAADRLDIRNLAVTSKMLQVSETGGSLSQLTTKPVADLRGQVQYDLAVMTNLLRAYLGETANFSGAGRRPFQYQGRLPFGSDANSAQIAWWSTAAAEGSVGWDAASVFGFNAGQAELQAALRKGIVQFQPLDVSFNQGRLRTTPQIRLDTKPNYLVWSKDTMVDRAQLTEALCSSWLQYVAPALSQATRAQGQFSVQLPQGAVPLDDPQRSELAGTLSIHSAQVRPGPLTAQLVGLATKIDAIIKRRPAAALSSGNTVLNIAQQDVPFRMSQGRVHHEKFEVEIGDVVVRTSGYVAMDHSIGLVAEIPIRDKWVQRDKLLRALRGQTLRIPIRGTLSQPKLDERAVQELAKQMLAGAANGFLEDAIDKGLKKGLDELFR